MKNTFKFEIHGKTGNGNTYTTTGEVAGDISMDYDPMINSALRQSFEQLTSGKAVFGRPGYGCSGPYSITHLILSKPESPLPQSASHPALGAAQFLTNEGLPERDYEPQAIPPGAIQGDSTMSNQHHPHHHHEKAAEDAGTEKLAETGQTAGSLTSGDSTNPPADQGGSQAAAAETAPVPESVAADAPAAEPVNEIAQTAQDDGVPF